METSLISRLELKGMLFEKCWVLAVEFFYNLIFISLLSRVHQWIGLRDWLAWVCLKVKTLNSGDWGLSQQILLLSLLILKLLLKLLLLNASHISRNKIFISWLINILEVVSRNIVPQSLGLRILHHELMKVFHLHHIVLCWLLLVFLLLKLQLLLKRRLFTLLRNLLLQKQLLLVFLRLLFKVFVLLQVILQVSAISILIILVVWSLDWLDVYGLIKVMQMVEVDLLWQLILDLDATFIRILRPVLPQNHKTVRNTIEWMFHN